MCTRAGAAFARCTAQSPDRIARGAHATGRKWGLGMRREMKPGGRGRLMRRAILVLSLTGGLAEANDLRIAAWNLEHLNDEHGEGCVERTEEDFDAIARRIEALDADLVAFQEVENEAAARRVFDPGKWNVVMSSRPPTGERQECWGRPEGRLQRQATGIAVRRSVAFRRGTDVAALALGNPHLRWGTHIVVGRGDRRLHVLSVHLKSGCWGALQDEQGREACAILRDQVRALGAWIDERRRAGERFAIAGDFNRRLAIPGDWVWNALSPETHPLELTTAGYPSHCDSRYPDYIDHIVLGGPSGPIGKAGSFREEARDGPHPDHCPLSVAIGDGPAGGATTRVALAAWTAAFARTSTDQMVGSIERRLFQGSGSYATLGVAQLLGEDRTPGLADILSRGSFRLSPSNGTGGRRWSLWGAGATGSTSAGEHDVRSRVRTATLGADLKRGPATLGVALAHSRGWGSTTPTGPIDAELSTVAPYVGIAPREGVRLWGVLGVGTGALSFEPTAGEPLRTDLEVKLGAAGLRAAIGEVYRMQWSTRGSAAFTAIETDRIADLAPIDSTAGRLGVAIDGSRRFDLDNAAALTPGLELGLRRDAGNGSNATALELGAGIRYASGNGRLAAEARASRSLANQDGEGWEIGGKLVIRPDSRQRGLSLTLAPAWGKAEDERASGPNGDWYLTPDEGDGGQVGAEIGYGMRIGGGRGTVEPYAAVEWAAGDDRTARLGARWRWGESVRCSVEAEHEAVRGENDGFALLARTRIRW